MSATALRIAISIVFVAVAACQTTPAAPPEIVTLHPPPPIEEIALPPIQLRADSALNAVPIRGIQSQTKDGISIIASLSTATPKRGDSLSTWFRGPDRQEYVVGLAPAIFRLKIRNGTEQEIILQKTIFVVEDEKQVEYSTADTLSTLKAARIQEIEAAYEQYETKVNASIDRMIPPESPYAKQFEKLRLDYYCAHSPAKDPCPKERRQTQRETKYAGPMGYIPVVPTKVRTPEMPEGVYLRETLNFDLPNEAFTTDFGHLEPDTVREDLRADALFEIHSSLRGVRRSIGSISDGLYTIITSDDYDPIKISPGRTREILIPVFDLESESLHTAKSLRLGIYDVPTKMNSSNEPIVTQHFDFEFTR